ADGGIGEIQRVTWIITDWFRTQQYYDSGSWRATWAGEGGGVLINQCPHQIDLVQWVVGMTPKTVRGFCHYGKWHDIEVEDDVTAYFEYENGATGVFITTTGEAPGTNRFEVSGTKGKLLCEKGKLFWYKNIQDSRDFSLDPKNTFGNLKSEKVEV
ncbi:MAG: gfo/Idh/MocA family oxidoreductase, partial [Clostridia bacterium]|nr:gfo/Idh/MocA family oxidoreductase [Clostridia bacterium]